MLLAQKQTHISMEQDRKPRNKPMHICSTNLQKKRQEYTMGKNTVSSISGVGKSGWLHVKKNETRCISYHIKIKWIKDLM